jgi:hypothetical protein
VVVKSSKRRESQQAPALASYIEGRYNTAVAVAVHVTGHPYWWDVRSRFDFTRREGDRFVTAVFFSFVFSFLLFVLMTSIVGCP